MTHKISSGELEKYVDILKSKNKLKIFSELDTEEKPVSEIQNVCKIKSRAKVNEYLTELENIGLVKRGVGKRSLTIIGKILQIKLKEFINTIYAIEGKEDYWNTHLINIPDKFLPYFYVFSDADVIGNTVDDNNKVFKEVKKLLNKDKTRCFYAIVSGYSKNYGKVVENMLKNDWNVEAIMSKNLYTNLKKENKKEILSMKERYKNGKLYLSDKVDKFTILFTDDILFLFLFKSDGNIEWNECLSSKNKEAIVLARKIFEFYKENAIEISGIR